MFELVREMNAAMDQGGLGSRRRRDWSATPSPNSIRFSASCPCAAPKTSSRPCPSPRSNSSSPSAARPGANATSLAPTRSARTSKRAASSSRTARPARAGKGSSRWHCPSHHHAASGPESGGDHRARQSAGVDLVHARLPVRDGERRGRGRGGRRRERLSRLRGRHRGHRHGALAPRRHQGDRRSGAQVPAHVGDGLLLRTAGATRRGDGGHRPGRRRHRRGPVVFQQLRHGGERSRHQAGAATRRSAST